MGNDKEQWIRDVTGSLEKWILCKCYPTLHGIVGPQFELDLTQGFFFSDSFVFDFLIFFSFDWQSGLAGPKKNCKQIKFTN